MRRATPLPIGEILKSVVENLNQRKDQGIARIGSSWPKIAGTKFARHSRPAGFKKGLLIINVDESAWLYQMNLQRERLLKNLQARLEEENIQTIKFRIGAVK